MAQATEKACINRMPKRLIADGRERCKLGITRQQTRLLSVLIIKRRRAKPQPIQVNVAMKTYRSYDLSLSVQSKTIYVGSSSSINRIWITMAVMITRMKPAALEIIVVIEHF